MHMIQVIQINRTQSIGNKKGKNEKNNKKKQNETHHYLY